MIVGLQQGDLLIAPPGIKDPRFAKTVLMLVHLETTSLAFCLNRPTRHRCSELVKDMGIELDPDVVLNWGGPVTPSTVWMLHDPSWRMQHSIDITEQWLLTSHGDMFNPLAQGHRPQRYWCLFGCASWAPGQLESELLGVPPWKPEHSWLTLSDPDPEWLATTSSDDLWIASTELCAKQTTSQWMC